MVEWRPRRPGLLARGTRLPRPLLSSFLKRPRPPSPPQLLQPLSAPLVEATPPPKALSASTMAAALAQELSQLSLNGAGSLETLAAAAQKGAAAEVHLLQHLPALLKATADKVRPPGRYRARGALLGARRQSSAATAAATRDEFTPVRVPTLLGSFPAAALLNRAPETLPAPPEAQAPCMPSPPRRLESLAPVRAAGCRDPRRRRQGWRGGDVRPEPQCGEAGAACPLRGARPPPTAARSNGGDPRK